MGKQFHSKHWVLLVIYLLTGYPSNLLFKFTILHQLLTTQHVTEKSITHELYEVLLDDTILSNKITVN